jgi:hypothetical protein
VCDSTGTGSAIEIYTAETVYIPRRAAIEIDIALGHYPIRCKYIAFEDVIPLVT